MSQFTRIPPDNPVAFAQCKDVSINHIAERLDQLILSASGWRGVFAREEEDHSTDLSPIDAVIAAAAADNFCDFLITSDKSSQNTPALRILLASDSRPTGKILAQICQVILVARGVKVQFLGIASAPEAMCYPGETGKADAFIYISASHNPVGHNGFKFGRNDGGVLDAPSANILADAFRRSCANQAYISEIATLLANAQSGNAPDVKTGQKPAEASLESEGFDIKTLALENYRKFALQILNQPATDDLAVSLISRGLQHSPVGILADFNGSARCVSIDRQYLGELGVQFSAINDEVGNIAHRIVPEGRSLDYCRQALEKAHAEEPAYILGYMPDNDGDRGNLVYIATDGRARILEAQQVFALVALAESAWMEYSGVPGESQAIAVNGPTSMRVDDIASAFGIAVHRAEVGEANVVGLARSLREKGLIVRLMGEGSNGGNITYPSAVRDPINSIGSVLKLLCIRDEPGDSSTATPGLFHIWCDRRGISYNDNFTLDDVLDSLPQYTTTSAYEDRALLKITSTDHMALKAAYEVEFNKKIDRFMQDLSGYGITSWDVIQTEGGVELHGAGPDYRSGKGKGGYKVRFHDAEGPCAYIWMRGSGTEPVFRILADVRGDNTELESTLLNWHKECILAADAACSQA